LVNSLTAPPGSNVQVAILEQEKRLLAAAEERASFEVASLSGKLHHTQALLEATRTRLDTQGETASAERQRLLEEVQRLQVSQQKPPRADGRAQMAALRLILESKFVDRQRQNGREIMPCGSRKIILFDLEAAARMLTLKCWQ
jgi:hypothetical protein